jgi:hypothetical protein
VSTGPVNGASDLYSRRHVDPSPARAHLPAVNAEFNWWLLIVGLVGGAGLVWLILGDWSRREEEVGEAERARESEWIAETMRDEGTAIDPATAEEVLRRHRVWLRETGDYDPLEDEWATTGIEHEPVSVPAAASAPAPAAAPAVTPALAPEARPDSSVRAPERTLRGEPPAPV